MTYQAKNIGNNMYSIAKLKWIPKENGGREIIPVSGSHFYAPIIKHAKLKGNWTVLVDNYEKIDDHTTMAKVSYTFEKSPNDLEEGLIFDLWEGDKKVAEGIIIKK